jgi:hypothetical protein
MCGFLCSVFRMNFFTKTAPAEIEPVDFSLRRYFVATLSER